MKRIVFALLMMFASSAMALISLPALWHQGLSSTSLVGYQKDESLIISDVWTGTPTVDATVKYQSRVKVSAWDKPFNSTTESADKRQKEVLTVTLHETSNPKEMKAEFDHVISENGTIILRFSGITVLARPN